MMSRVVMKKIIGMGLITAVLYACNVFVENSKLKRRYEDAKSAAEISKYMPDYDISSIVFEKRSFGDAISEFITPMGEYRKQYKRLISGEKSAIIKNSEYFNNQENLQQLYEYIINNEPLDLSLASGFAAVAYRKGYKDFTPHVASLIYRNNSLAYIFRDLDESDFTYYVATKFAEMCRERGAISREELGAISDIGGWGAIKEITKEITPKSLDNGCFLIRATRNIRQKESVYNFLRQAARHYDIDYSSELAEEMKTLHKELVDFYRYGR